MKRLPALLLAFSAVLAASRAGAAQYRQFWLTEAVSGRTVGPITGRPGNRFECGGESWVILKTENEGEIDFADMRTLTAQGPYDLVEQRMIDLGPKSYVFVKVSDFDGDDPAADRSVVSQAVRERASAPSSSGRHDWSGEIPERWVLGPVPSTNPGAHKLYAEPWSLQKLVFPPSVAVFAEPFRSVQYDWSLGGLEGGRKKALESRRAGVRGEWNGFCAEAGLAFGAKTSGSVVSDGVSLSSLSFGGGDGFFAGGGYDWRFRIDGGWSASVGAHAFWERVRGDVSARTTSLQQTSQIGADGVTNSVSTYRYGEWSGGATLSEVRIDAACSIRYDEWYWGLGAAFLIDCVSDTSLSADVPVLGRTYSLEADRSQPVALRFGGWYSPGDNLLLEASATIGAEKTLRLSAGWYF